MSFLRVVVWAACAVAGLSLASCGGPDYPKCENDDHCKEDKDGNDISEYCLFGQCQECAKDSHCKNGKKCMTGRCELPCESDGQCGAGNICDGKKCTKAECTDASACGGAPCENGRCKTAGKDGADKDANGRTVAVDDGKPCEKSARIGFGYNDSDLPADSRANLDAFAKCMQKNTDWKLMIEGHADERGTTEYNLQLGDARAKSIKKYLTTLGVEANRLRVVSYGEEKPLESTSNESAWASNRRGELKVQ
jgi:peptidoglycan-associated lipoprotein